MKARIDWIRDLTFVGESNSGHGIVISAPKQGGPPTDRALTDGICAAWHRRLHGDRCRR